MKRLMMLLALLVLAMAQPAVAGAQGDEVEEARGFMRSDGTILMAARMDAGSASTAKAFVLLADDDLIEESFGYVVTDRTVADKSALRGLNADAAVVFDVTDPSTGMNGGLVVSSKRANVFVIVNLGFKLTGEDGAALAPYARQVHSVGIQLADPPEGYVEIGNTETGF